MTSLPSPSTTSEGTVLSWCQVYTKLHKHWASGKKGCKFLPCRRLAKALLQCMRWQQSSKVTWHYVPVPHLGMRYPMWKQYSSGSFLRIPLFHMSLPPCWTVLLDSCFSLGCLSLPSQKARWTQFVLLPEKQKCTLSACSSGNPQLFTSLSRRWETSSGLARLHGQVLTKTRHSYSQQPFTFSKMKAKPQLCVSAVSSAWPLKSSGHDDHHC